MTDVNRFSPHGILALASVLADGSGDLEGGTVMGMLLDNTTTIDTQWDDAGAVTIAYFSTKGEYGGAGASRLTLDSVAVAVPAGTKTVTLDFADEVITTLADSGTPLEHFLLYVKKDGAAAPASYADRVPLALFSISAQPDGEDYTIVPPLGGVTIWDTA